jgi:hypothetical protein
VRRWAVDVGIKHGPQLAWVSAFAASSSGFVVGSSQGWGDQEANMNPASGYVPTCTYFRKSKANKQTNLIE